MALKTKSMTMRCVQRTFSVMMVLILTMSGSVCIAEGVGGGTPLGSGALGGRLVNTGDVGKDNLLGGKWMEIARTDVPSERGCSRVTVEFAAGVEGRVEMFAQGWDNGAGVWRSIGLGGAKHARTSRWWFLNRSVPVREEVLHCFKGDDADGWIAMVGSDGVRVLSRSGGMSQNGWERCCAALRNAGQPVGGLIYFLSR